jgi:hypothetical protein
MNHVLKSMMRLMRRYLQLLQQSFREWTKPSTTSLLLGALTDLLRSKSPLVAANALLRQQLILLSRQIKRPVYARKDRILLVLLARMVRTWTHALLIVQEDDAPALASPGISIVVEGHVQSGGSQTEDLHGDRGGDQGNGSGQPPVESRTDPGRSAQAGSARLHTHDPDRPETAAPCQATRTDLEDLLPHACRADPGSLGPATSSTSRQKTRALKRETLNCLGG